MKKIKILVIFLAVALFIAVPLPSADLYLRVYFSEIAGQFCALYYSTESSNFFSQEQCVISDIDPERNMVTFRLDGSLKDQITGFRLDFPSDEDLICVSNITVSSAGIVQKQFNPIHFFADENFSYSNDIAAISLVDPRDTAYILTESSDPYLIFSANLVKQITDGYSCYRLTRLGICLFAAACFFMTKKNLFKSRLTNPL